MRIPVRSLSRIILGAMLAIGTLALAGSALADYTGPDRDISTSVWQRLVCDYQAQYDEPGPGGFYSCTLTLYESPDGRCPGNVGDYFHSTACVGWPSWLSCDDEDCDISRSSSIDTCREGQRGCREVEQIVSQPPATITGSIVCGAPGSGGWCRGAASLSLAGSEPLAGESITMLEGTHNSAPFNCPGSSCDVSLLEGINSFSFWSHSTWGDTSEMGSASGSLDTGDPLLAGSASGTIGDNGWFVSSAEISASASDAVSGVASLDARLNGGEWLSFTGPVTLGDGSHTIDLRAVDVAGNTANETLGVNVDTISPTVDLDAIPSFCPGCGEILDITAVAVDGGSGIVHWALTADGSNVAAGGSATSGNVSWDGGGLAGGMHTLTLAARDAAGNSATAEFTVGLILPTPTPTEVRRKAPAATATQAESPTSLPSTATAIPPPAASSTAGTLTPTPAAVLFGGPPAAPGPREVEEPPAGELFVPPAEPAATVPPTGLYIGAVALVLGAAATAFAVNRMQHTKSAESGRWAAAAAEAEQARLAALAAAKEQAEFELTLGQILNQATAGQGPSPEWMASKEAMLGADGPPVPDTPSPGDRS